MISPRRDSNLSPIASDEELLTRAMRAYFIRAKKEGEGVDQPSSSASGIEEGGHNQKFVVLRNCNGVLAAYRVRKDGRLLRLMTEVARWF
jgi:hypothetical protein